MLNGRHHMKSIHDHVAYFAWAAYQLAYKHLTPLTTHTHACTYGFQLALIISFVQLAMQCFESVPWRGTHTDTQYLGIKGA